MRFCRYMTTEGVRYGVVENVDGVDTITKTMPSPQLMVNQYGVPDAVQLAGADKFEDVKIPTALDLAVTLIPFPVVSKIVCVGRNYGEHAKELGNEVPKSPLIFLKPPSALLAPHGEIRRPTALSQRVDFEGELGHSLARLQPDYLLLIIQRNPPHVAAAVTPGRLPPGTMQVFAAEAPPHLVPAEQLLAELAARGFFPHHEEIRSVQDGKAMVGLVLKPCAGVAKQNSLPGTASAPRTT